MTQSTCLDRERQQRLDLMQAVLARKGDPGEVLDEYRKLAAEIFGDESTPEDPTVAQVSGCEHGGNHSLDFAQTGPDFRLPVASFDLLRYVKRRLPDAVEALLKRGEREPAARVLSLGNNLLRYLEDIHGERSGRRELGKS